MSNPKSLRIDIPPYAFHYQTPPKRNSDSSLSNHRANLEDEPPTSTTLFFHFGRTQSPGRDHVSSKNSKTHSKSPILVYPLDSTPTPDFKEQYSTPLEFQESHNSEVVSSSPVAAHTTYGSPGTFKYLPLREYSRSQSKEASPKAESRASPLGSPISFTHTLYLGSLRITHSPSLSKPTSPISTHRSSCPTFLKISKNSFTPRSSKKPSLSPNSRTSPTPASPARRTTSPGPKEISMKPSPASSPPIRRPSPVNYHGLNNKPTTPPHLRSSIPSKPPAPAYPTARAAMVEITLYNLYILKHYLSAILYQISISRPNSHFYSSRYSAIPFIHSILTLLSQLASRVEALRPYPKSYYLTPSTELSSFVSYINSHPSALVAMLASSAHRHPSIQAVVTEATKAIRKDIWSFSKQHIFDCARFKRGVRIAADDRSDTVMKVWKVLGKEIDGFERAMCDLRELKAGSEAGGAEGSLVGDTTAGSESSSSVESVHDLSQRVTELSDKLDLLVEYLKDWEKKCERRNRAIEKLSRRVVSLERTA